MLYFSTISNLESKKFLGKIRMVFGEIDPQLYKFWKSIESSKMYVEKISRQHCYSKIFLRHLIPYTEGKWSKYFQHMVSRKKTVKIIMMLYKKIIDMVCSPDGDTNFFVIVLKEDTLVSYLFIIYQDYVLWILIDLIR